MIHGCHQGSGTTPRVQQAPSSPLAGHSPCGSPAGPALESPGRYWVQLPRSRDEGLRPRGSKLLPQGHRVQARPSPSHALHSETHTETDRGRAPNLGLFSSPPQGKGHFRGEIPGEPGLGLLGVDLQSQPHPGTPFPGTGQCGLLLGPAPQS